MSARLCQKTIEMARADGYKIGLLRPITLYPFPGKRIGEYAPKLKGMMTVEMSAGQMVEDVKLVVEGKVQVEHFGRMGGVIPTPDEIYKAFLNKLAHA